LLFAGLHQQKLKLAQINVVRRASGNNHPTNHFPLPA
jgi:hypothetical protein